MDIHYLYLQQMLPMQLKEPMIFKEALRTIIKSQSQLPILLLSRAIQV